LIHAPGYPDPGTLAPVARTTAVAAWCYSSPCAPSTIGITLVIDRGRVVAMTITAPVRPAAADPLTAARAAKELAEVRLLREALRAWEAGRPQVAIAEALGVSQAGVSKMLVRARLAPEVAGDTPWEVALCYAAGELSHEQMIETFTAWPWTHDRFLDAGSAWPEQYVRGSWQDVVRAADEGYISRGDYAELFERTA
jgi:hypothetical protein